MDKYLCKDDLFYMKYIELKGQNKDVDHFNLIDDYELISEYANNCQGYYKDDEYYDCENDNYYCHNCGIIFYINDAENIEMLYEIYKNIICHIDEHCCKSDESHCFCELCLDIPNSYYIDYDGSKSRCCLECKAMFEDENDYVLK
jgi:hypothetical protein